MTWAGAGVGKPFISSQVSPLSLWQADVRPDPLPRLPLLRLRNRIAADDLEAIFVEQIKDYPALGTGDGPYDVHRCWPSLKRSRNVTSYKAWWSGS